MKLKIYNKFELIPNIEKVKNNIPIFASQKYAYYLKESKKSNVIWIVGEFNRNNNFLIPLAIIKKGPFKKGTFLTAVISLVEKNTIQLEKEFLNKIVKYIKNENICDWIQQGPNWAIFRTYPDGAVYAPFGTYRIDLEGNTIEELYKNLNRNKRQRINKVTRQGEVVLKVDEVSFGDSIKLIQSTLIKAKLPTFTKEKFDLLFKYFGDNLLISTTYFNGIPQSSIIFIYNSYSVYGLYAGSIEKAAQGATELIVWESIKKSKNKKIKYFDFVGARINPSENSKQFRIQRNKAHFGSQLQQGFLWKMVINKKKHLIFVSYNKIMNLLKGKKGKGDIIDQEIKRLGIK